MTIDRDKDREREARIDALIEQLQAKRTPLRYQNVRNAHDQTARAATPDLTRPFGATSRSRKKRT